MEKVYDFIVVGSGFGGSVASLRLSEKVYSVLTIEKGRKFAPQDFPKNNWNLRKYLWMPRLGFSGTQKLIFNRKAGILSGVGVGGGSLVYANALFYPPDHFYPHDSWKKYGKWKKILKAFYDKAACMMGRTLYEKVNPEDGYLREVAKDMNRSDSFEHVHVGVFLDRNYPYFAEKSGTVIMAGTRGVKIECQRSGYVVHTLPSTWLLRPKLRKLRCKGLILAGGSLGTLELLLKHKYQYKTLAALSDTLGSSLLTNAETLCAVSRIPAKTNNGLAMTSVFNMRWSTNLVLFLVMQHIENAMRMVWKKGWWGGRTALENSFQKRVPACVEVGQNVRDGVISPDLSVHGYPGMYIVDGSAIQGNLGINPSYTILAMAECAMNKIPEKRDQPSKQEVQPWPKSR